MDDFDIEDEGLRGEGGGQEYTGGFVRGEGEIDYTGTYADRDRTGGGKAFEKSDLYDRSPEGKMMDEVRKVIGTYNFPDSKANKIEDVIKEYDIKLKLSNPDLIVSATLFLDKYGRRGGLNKKNFQAFEKERRKDIKKLDLIRYVRFLLELGMEV
uniref:Uncharacterized protein n=1 Tax=Marseillevirus LCMAC101 TaxID=2506602 RepID=A0A481YRB9_9VIRU|nr:MAG: hypothetical protein LCMAC101_03560 [Marseillevirus LCMAC101]